MDPEVLMWAVAAGESVDDVARSLVASAHARRAAVVPRRRRADLGGPQVSRPRRLPQGAVRRRRGRARRLPRDPVQRRTARCGGGQRHLLSRCRWRAARPGTPTSRSGSATPSAASCAPSARTSPAPCASTCSGTRRGAGPRRPTARTRTTSASSAPPLTRGLQRHVMACVKHFACNSMENARFSVDIEVDDVALHEVYLPHFRRIVDEGVASVMSAYNSVNGEWCGQNRELLTDVLRGEWGFEGFVISDWIFGLRDAATSLTAGLDIEMPYRMVRAQHLAGALERGDAVVGRRRPRRRADRRHAAALRRRPVRSRSSGGRARDRPSIARSPARSPPARSSCCATSPSTARRSCRSPPKAAGRGARPPRRHRQPRRRRVERRVGPRLRHRRRRAPRRPRRRRPRRRHRHRARGRGRRRRRCGSGGRRLHLSRRGRVHRRDRPLAARHVSRAPTSPTSSISSTNRSPRFPRSRSLRA